jgi:signal peptidase II
MTGWKIKMLPYVLILLAFAADRLSKLWVADFAAENGFIQINSLISFHPTYNRGIAFGLLQGIGPAMGWISIAIVIFLFVYMVRTPKSMTLLRIGLALIIGGAVGNLIDRVTTGQVLDFIQTPLRPGIFNVADVMINLGVLLSVAGVFLQRPKSEDENQQSFAELEDHPL